MRRLPKQTRNKACESQHTTEKREEFVRSIPQQSWSVGRPLSFFPHACCFIVSMKRGAWRRFCPFTTYIPLSESQKSYRRSDQLQGKPMEGTVDKATWCNEKGHGYGAWELRSDSSLQGKRKLSPFLSPSLQQAPISGRFGYQNMIYTFVMRTIKSLLEYSGTEIDLSS